jgi:epsilon-lactone hydrolase
MPSTESRFLGDIYSSKVARLAALPNADLTTMRSLYEEEQICASEPSGVTYEDLRTDHFSGIWVSPVTTSPFVKEKGRPVIMYMHGGGFTFGSPSSRRKVMGHICRAANTDGFIIQYRLTPDHKFPVALNDTLAAYRWLLNERQVPASGIVFAGESAGGNLSTTLVILARQEGLPYPAAVVAFSPWYNLENTFQSMDSNDKTDLLAHRPQLDGLAAAYVGDNVSLREPLVSPIYAKLDEDMPPMFISVGSDETLRDDGIEFAKLAREAGIRVELEVVQGQQHAHILMAGRAPEADVTISKVGEWLKGMLF